MFIKLPIIKNNKIVFTTFRLEKKDNIIVLNTLDNSNKYIKFVCFNNFNCYNDIDIFLPLSINIIKNTLYTLNFFIFSLLYEKDANNFIYLIEKNIKDNINKSYCFIKINLKDIESICNILSYNNNTSNTFTELLHNIYNKNSYYYNMSLVYLYLSHNNINISVEKKNQSVVNLLQNTKITYYGINDTFNNHIKYINGTPIESGAYYINYDNKILKVNITKNNVDEYYINGKKIDIIKYNITKYPLKFNKFINIKTLFLTFIKHFDITQINDIVSKKNNMLIPYFIDNDFNNCIIDNMNYTDELYKSITSEYCYCNNNFNFVFFKNKIANIKEFNEDIFNQLIEHYTYPFHYNSNLFTENFKKIIYYFYKHNDMIKYNMNISKHKIKYIYNSFLKIINDIKNENYYVINNYKIYTDTIFINIFFGILNFDELNISKKYIINLKNKYYINLKGLNILNLLSWETFNNKINYYKYILDQKNNNNKLFYYENKINNYIIDINMDNKLKKILNDPLYLYMFLKRERDFIKWTFVLKNNMDLFYDNMFKIDASMLKKIGKIIFLLTNITDQDIENEKYLDIIRFLKKHNNLIIHNDRINMKIKDILKKNKLNLGFLAKHIVSESDETMIISPDSDNYTNLSEKLKKMTKRYYKYKGKYLNLKMSDMSSMNDKESI